MLDFMRRHAGTWMIKALLFAIVVVFIFWGVGSWTRHEEGIVATVNGEAISIESYRRQYNRMLDQVRQSFGTALSDELLRAMDLPNRALDELIDQVLLRQAAERFRLEVSDEELSRSVHRIPAFQANGRFDAARYRQVLSLNRMTPEVFESLQRESLLVQKLARIVTGGAQVSGREVEEWYAWNRQAVQVDWAVIESERFREVQATTEEIARHFEENREAYRRPAEVRVRFVRIDPEAFRGKLTPEERELEAYYEEHRERFAVPRTVEASHILLRLEADAPPEKVEAARARLAELRRRILEGADFAALAREVSEDPGSREQGGRLPAFRRGDVVPAFAEAAFALAPGALSEPVRTPFGWHLIRVERVNEERTRPFTEVKAEIAERLTRERARNAASELAEALYDAALASGDLAQAAAGQGLEIQSTGFFSREQPPAGLAQPARFAEAAFALAPGEVSDILDLPDGYFLLQHEEARPSRIPELAEVEERVRADVVRRKQAERALEQARALLADLKGGASPEATAKKYGVSFRPSGFFQRSDAIEGLGHEPAVNRAAFELSERKPFPEEPLATEKGFCVIRFAGRRDPEAAGLERERERIREQLLQQKRVQLWEAWMNDLRRSGKIERRKDLA